MRATFCTFALTLTGFAIATSAQEKESLQAETHSKTMREQVRGQWRHSGEQLLRITGRVKILDAHTLLFEDGTEVDLNGGMDAPDLEQKAEIRGALYPCGKEAAEFLRKLIGNRPVICFSDWPPQNPTKIRQADAFIGETNLNIEMVRNGWAMAHHSGMAAWEAMARENKRGLWRGTFVFPERWRKGDRLAGE